MARCMCAPLPMRTPSKRMESSTTASSSTKTSGNSTEWWTLPPAITAPPATMALMKMPSVPEAPGTVRAGGDWRLWVRMVQSA